MDKTEQILQSLKSSIDPISQKAQAATAPGSPLGSTLDFMGALGSSLINNPLFYIKLLAIIALTIMIVMVSIGLITDG